MEPVSRVSPPGWMNTPETAAVMDALAGQEARGPVALFVGGCVRDTLLGRARDGDIDIATSLPPRETLRRLDAAGLRSIPTGIDHGTVTAVAGGRHFEITTLRVDVETDGRRARVAYTDDWLGDAQRRDFTMNALYADRAGAIYDPVGGLTDLRAGLVRFVGDPDARIGEDVLRLLRFFRFHAHYGSGAPDIAGLAACRRFAHALPDLSGERIAQEVLRLMLAPDPARTVRLMLENDILAPVLPQVENAGRLAALVTVEGVADRADAIRRLAATIEAAEAASDVAARLRMSNAQRDRLVALAGPHDGIDPDRPARAHRACLYRRGAALWRDRALLAWADNIVVAGPGDRRRSEAWRALVRLAETWVPPGFPLSGDDALAAGLSRGPEVGHALAAVESWWIDGDFAADREACLTRLREVVAARPDSVERR